MRVTILKLEDFPLLIEFEALVETGQLLGSYFKKTKKPIGGTLGSSHSYCGRWTGAKRQAED